MLVRCIGNKPKDLVSERAKKAFSRNIHQDEVWLEVGKTYRVYGIAFRDGEDIPWYLVSEEDCEYPKAHLGDFFEIVDGTIPSGWKFTTTASNVGAVAILPTPWADDPYFLEKLIDEDPISLDYYRELRAQN